MLYVPLFLVWAGHTTYATRFDDGSTLQTILTLLLAGSLLLALAALGSLLKELHQHRLTAKKRKASESRT